MIIGPIGIAALLFSCGLCVPLFGQVFQNGCFDGVINGQSSLATHWFTVAWNDVTCNASGPSTATPDLTSINQPEPNAGIIGQPFCGTNFMSGLIGTDDSLHYHEGIRQAVYGLVPGQQYLFTFRQAVIKQINAMDTSGAWVVYRDNDLLMTSNTSTNTLDPLDTALIWDRRTVVFTATAVGHTFKFLPWDDDTSSDLSETDEAGALRMGIDSITFFDPSTDVEPQPYTRAIVAPTLTDGPVNINMGRAREGARIEVFTSEGRSVLRLDVPPSGDHALDLGGHPPGLYVLRIQWNDHRELHRIMLTDR